MLTIKLADIPLMKLADLKRECRALGIAVSGNKNELSERLSQYILQAYSSNASYSSQFLNNVNSSNPNELYSLQVQQDTNMTIVSDEAEEEKLLNSSNEDISLDNINPNETKNTLLPDTNADVNHHMVKLDNISNLPTIDRKVLRNEKFSNHQHLSFQSDEKLMKRARRFGMPVKSDIVNNSSTNPSPKTNSTIPNVTKLSDVKRQRALRFGAAGENPSSLTTKTTTTFDQLNKKSIRALRFGLI